MAKKAHKAQRAQRARKAEKVEEARESETADRSEADKAEEALPPNNFSDRLRSLAAETRLEIFKYALLGAVRRGRTPELVKALRGQQPFYEEIITVWYQTSVVSLAPGRGRNSFCHLEFTTSTMSLLKKLRVEHKPYLPFEKAPPVFMRVWPNLAVRHFKILEAKNLEYLELDFSRLDSRIFRARGPLEWHRIVESWFKRMKKLQVLVIVFQGGWGRQVDFVSVQILNTCFGIDAVDRVTEQQLKLQSFRYPSPAPTRSALWKAEKGQFLTWRKAEKEVLPEV